MISWANGIRNVKDSNGTQTSLQGFIVGPSFKGLGGSTDTVVPNDTEALMTLPVDYTAFQKAQAN